MSTTLGRAWLSVHSSRAGLLVTSPGLAAQLLIGNVRIMPNPLFPLPLTLALLTPVVAAVGVALASNNEALEAAPAVRSTRLGMVEFLMSQIYLAAVVAIGVAFQLLRDPALSLAIVRNCCAFYAAASLAIIAGRASACWLLPAMWAFASAMFGGQGAVWAFPLQENSTITQVCAAAGAATVVNLLRSFTLARPSLSFSDM